MDLRSGNINAGGNLGPVNSYNNSIIVNPIEPQEARITLANWVSDLNFSQHQSQAFERYTEGTLLWVLEVLEFVNWLTHGGMLWCHGEPGAGKTVFASFVVDYLQNLNDRQPKPTVCYLYCQYNVTRSTLQLFEAILKQLILRCPSANLQHLQDVKDRGQRLTLKEILSTLQEIFTQVPNIFIIIDAFDECFDEPTRHQVLRHLQALHSVHILITSRPLPSIQSAMSGVRRMIISAHGEDIKTHFRAQTNINPTLANLVSKVSVADIEGKLIEKAHERFLLAGLHIASLASQTNATELRRALEILPQEVATSYEQTLDRIRHQGLNQRRLAFHTLSWILYALRPLSMIELRHALAIGRLNVDRMAEEEDLDDENSIISSCAGLIVMNRSNMWHHYHTVNFLHYTVREFLQQARTAPDFLSEIEIAMRCIKVISCPGIVSDPPNYPFIQYAASSWGPLVRQHEGNQGVLDEALFQLGEERTVDILSGTGISYEFRSYSGDYGGQCGATAIHLIAVYGLVRTAEAFMAIHGTASSLINKTDSLGCTALIWAANNGHLELVKILLLHSQIDVNFQSTKYDFTALSCATSNGHIEIVKELLRHPNINPNSGCPRNGLTPLFYATGNTDHGQTPLCYAAEIGSTAVVQQLLAHPKIDVNVADKFRRTPLLCATVNEHWEVVWELLAHPEIDVNSRDTQYRTPLCHAARSGWTAVVKELLAHPEIDVNLKDGEHSRTPLHHAIVKGHSKVVQELLAHPEIDVNSRDTLFGTPLCHAARSGWTPVVKELLARPEIDVNAADAYRKTPLLYAASQGYSEVVRELLAHPEIDVNSGDTLYDIPLCHASRSGWTAVVKELLAHPRIDVNAADMYRKTPFLHAASKGYLEVVRELLAHPKIDVNSRDALYDIPLCHAARSGWTAVVKELLAHPEIDVNAADTHRKTPLLHAASKGHSRVVRELLAHPEIDVNSRGTLYGTPLCHAARFGWTAVVKELLAHPEIDVNAKDEEYSQTPLLHAIIDGHLELVQKLVAHPNIDVNSWDDGFGLTPVCLAIKYEDLDIVRALLDHPDIDVNSKDEVYGFAPLSCAVYQGNIQLVQEVLTHPKTDVNSRDTEYGRTPLSYAAEAGDFGIVELLLAIPDIDINSRDTMWGLTPILWAANNGHISVVNLLLDTDEIPLPGNRKFSLELPVPSFPSTSHPPTPNDLEVLRSSPSRSEATSRADLSLQNPQPPPLRVNIVFRNGRPQLHVYRRSMFPSSSTLGFVGWLD